MVDKSRVILPLRHVAVHVQAMMGAGLLVTLPIGVTVLILKFFFDLLDPILQESFLQFLPGPKIPGLGILTLLVLVYLIGLVATQVIGRKAIDLGHSLVERIPVIKSIYSTTRTAVGLLSSSTDHPYSRVVLVEFPAKNMRSIGLVTAQLGIQEGRQMFAVYVPTTPIPSSGFLIVVAREDMTPTELSVDDAMKIIVSGGIMSVDVKKMFSANYPPSEGAPQQEQSGV